MKITTQDELNEFLAGVREREAYASRLRELADPDRINRRIDNANLSQASKDNLRLLLLTPFR